MSPARTRRGPGRLRLPLARFCPTPTLGELLSAVARLPLVGPEENRALEHDFAQVQGLKRAWFLGSARLGMYLALRGLKLPPGAPILLPAWTHPSVPAMVVAAGLQPRIADISPETFTMGPEQLTERDWEGVRAVIATHLYGYPAPVSGLAAEAARRGALLLEDCAQGFGARTSEARAGSQGLASFYSLYATKNFTTLGGGMVGVQDEALAASIDEALADAPVTPNRATAPALVKALAMWAATTRPGFAAGLAPLLGLGWALTGRDLLHPLFDESFSIEAPRISARPAPVQAWIGRQLLPRMDLHNRQRRENGLGLLERLRALRPPQVRLPGLPAEGTPIFMSFVITHPRRTALARALFRRGVDTSPGYMRPVTSVPVLSGRIEQLQPCPVAERLHAEQLHLPVYPGLSPCHLDALAEAVDQAAREVSR